MEEYFDITFVNAPNPASGPIPKDVAPFFPGPYFEWWNAERDPTHNIWYYENSDVTLSFLNDFIKLHGPFDGLMGFSQGAGTAALLMGLYRKNLQNQRASETGKMKNCADSKKEMQSSNEGIIKSQAQDSSGAFKEQSKRGNLQLGRKSCESTLDSNISFLLLIAGIRVRDPTLSTLYDSLGNVPSCHIIGDRDPVKPWTRLLIECFENPVVIEHERGHIVPPLEGKQLEKLRNFLETQRLERSAL